MVSPPAGEQRSRQLCPPRTHRARAGAGGRHGRAALLAAAEERELQRWSLSQRDLGFVSAADSSTSPLADLQRADHGSKSAAWRRARALLRGIPVREQRRFCVRLQLCFGLGCCVRQRRLCFGSGLHNACAQSELQRVKLAMSSWIREGCYGNVTCYYYMGMKFVISLFCLGL